MPPTDSLHRSIVPVLYVNRCLSAQLLAETSVRHLLHQDTNMYVPGIYVPLLYEARDEWRLRCCLLLKTASQWCYEEEYTRPRTTISGCVLLTANPEIGARAPQATCALERALVHARLRTINFKPLRVHSTVVNSTIFPDTLFSKTLRDY